MLFAAGRVVTERSETGSRVVAAGGVVKKSEHSTGRVVRAGSVVSKAPRRQLPYSRLRCWQKRPSTDSRVEVAGEVALE